MSTGQRVVAVMPRPMVRFVDVDRPQFVIVRKHHRGGDMAPRRIQWSAQQRYRGVKLTDLSGNRPVAVTRPGRWGNPFPVSDFGLEEALRLYRGWLRGDVEAVDEARRRGWRYPEFHGQRLVDEARRELAGRDLACACDLTEECHAGVLLRVANGGEP